MRRSLLPRLLLVLTLLSVALVVVAPGPAAAQDAPASVHLMEGEVPIGSASVDTPGGERIGRLAAANHFRNVSPAAASDPMLDAAAREQLRVAIDQAGALGTLGAGGRLVRVSPDTLVRLGVVSLAEADGRANLFSLVGPAQADAIGSAGGVATLGNPARTQLVAAVAWRDANLAALDDLPAIFGATPSSSDRAAGRV